MNNANQVLNLIQLGEGLTSDQNAYEMACSKSCLLVFHFQILRFSILAANRHFGDTNMNARSSRSHTIFRMVCSFS